MKKNKRTIKEYAKLLAIMFLAQLSYISFSFLLKFGKDFILLGICAFFIFILCIVGCHKIYFLRD